MQAMETAGKFVDDEELRAAMKENGIGRPSSRAGIIETLFKRHYIRRERKNLLATTTGIELIDIIHEELLKSCELTGIWEKKLREIEHKTYDAGQFINELKQQVTEIVNQVIADGSNRRVTLETTGPSRGQGARGKGQEKTKSQGKKIKGKAVNSNENNKPVEGAVCPLCGQGVIIKGHTAYGCSRWREGCTYRVMFDGK